MANYVIGSDKGLSEAYTADEIDVKLDAVDGSIGTLQQNLATTNSNLATTNANLATTNSNLATKQKAIGYGTAAPSGGSNGDIYIQY